MMQELKEKGQVKPSGKKNKKKILVIEDDSTIAEIIQYNLEKEGYEVECQADGLSGLQEARRWSPDLMILDLMLPTVDGIEVCREIRSDKSTKNIPVIMLTAKGEETDQIIGFTVGADDYVIKPFSVKVLMQRVRALLARRKSGGEESDVIQSHGILLDRVGHQVQVGGKPVPLTPTEYRLLETLITHPGRAFARDELMESAIGVDTIVLERTIDVHIRSLRQKLGETADAIQTVRGIGYRFARESADN